MGGQLIEQGLAPDQQELHDFMSELSEKYFSAGWLVNLEFYLWDALRVGGRLVNGQRLTSDELVRLKELSDTAGGWISYHMAQLVHDEYELEIHFAPWLTWYEVILKVGYPLPRS